MGFHNSDRDLAPYWHMFYIVSTVHVQASFHTITDHWN